MKSKYFGYTLRGAGTPYQQWILKELPISVTGVYTSSSTTPVISGSGIPVTSIISNQVGARLNSDGTISLPPGLYRVDYSLIVSTVAAGPVVVDLVSKGTVISETQGYTSTATSGNFTTTISGSGILKSCGCCGSESNFSIVNNSSVAITPVRGGTETMRVFITRLM